MQAECVCEAKASELLTKNEYHIVPFPFLIYLELVGLLLQGMELSDQGLDQD